MPANQPFEITSETNVPIPVGAENFLAPANQDTDITPVSQPPNSNWCWAACTQMVLQYFQQKVDQCQVVKLLRQMPGGGFPQIDCCNQPIDNGCLQTGLGASTNSLPALYLANWSNITTCNIVPGEPPKPGAPSQDFNTFVSNHFSQKNSPLQLWITLPGDISHNVLVTYAEVQSTIVALSIIDPKGDLTASFTTTDALLGKIESWSWTWAFT